MLNIARQIYAGWDIKVTKYDLPEAEIIPIGDTAHEKKKVDKFVKDFPVISEFDNVPLPGFTLYKTDKKHWGSLDNTWLVIDPRGFLVRIESKNLESILHVTVITEGLIQEKCVWAREDAKTKMVLVPMSSPDYITAVKNTEIIEDKVKLEDVCIGDTVLMQNEKQGVYRGVLSLYGPLCEHSRGAEYKPSTHLRRQIIEYEPGKFFFQADVKILKIISRSPTKITKEESADYINSLISPGHASFTSYSNFGVGNFYIHSIDIRHVSSSSVRPKLVLEEVSLTDAIDLFNIASQTENSGVLLLEQASQDRYIIEFPYIYSSNHGVATTIDTLNVAKATMSDTGESILTPNRPTHSSRALKTVHRLDKFTKFYKIVKCVKNKTYV